MTSDSAPPGLAPPDPKRVETWIFDLDNTLYRATRNMHIEVNRMLGSFVAELLDVDLEEARRIQKGYFRQYGLTLRGLMVEHGLDPAVYADFMLRADLSEIRPNPALAGVIGRLDGRKIVYTNAFAVHAERVLALLGLEAHFDAIYDIAAADYVPKPQIEAYGELCRRHDVEASSAVMVDDIARNLEPAASMGMTTVWMQTDADWGADGDKERVDGDFIHHVTDDIVGWLEGLFEQP